MTVKIISIAAADDTDPDDSERLLAHFDCEVRGIRLHDCSLIRTSRDFLLVLGPRGESRPAIRFVDKELRSAIADAAHRAFLALGGND